MTGSERSERPRADNEKERLRQIRQWAQFVRTHPDDEWGRQVNKLIDAQIASARHHRSQADPDGDRPTE